MTMGAPQGTQNGTPHLTIVAIGASAGGLEALKELVKELHVDSPCAFVVAQHLSPSHGSLLVELIARETTLRVVSPRNAETLQPHTIYVTPPNANIEIRGNAVFLEPPAPTVGPKPSINLLFASLAESQRARAIGVILSGTGSDGAEGAIAIRAAGGQVLVQDPATAKYDGMPNAAIGAGAATRVLSAAEAGQVLNDVTALRRLSESPPQESLRTVLLALRTQTGLDLTQYKTSTVKRRVARRMALRGQESYEAYAQLIGSDVEEVKCLTRDLLISVTDFFRDKAQFALLNDSLLGALASFDRDDSFRVWVPGCASGEEPYSIAILIEEAARALERPIRYQIFATDIDRTALARGREAVYPAKALSQMDPALVDRYFLETQKGFYQIRKSIRESVLFADHNLVADPPFSRIDLISCRNLMIYFTAPLQRQVFNTFHYALRDTGLLFLGKSENSHQAADKFLPLKKGGQIFRRARSSTPVVHAPASGVRRKSLGRMIAPVVRPKVADAFRDRLLKAAFDALSPPCIVIDEAGSIRFVNDAARDFLAIQAGMFEGVLFDLVAPELRSVLRALIHKTLRSRPAPSEQRVVLGPSERWRSLTVTVKSMPELEGHLLICLEGGLEPPAVEHLAPTDPGAIQASDIHAVGVHADVVRELENELESTRESLQTVVEELETSNEELQSLNEELQSSNEELQSTNEELQTSNEELQSTNEELLTVNEELHVKSTELELALSDMRTLQESVTHPFFSVDENLHLRRYNQAFFSLLSIRHAAVNDKINGLSWRFDFGELSRNLRATALDGQVRSVSVHVDGSHYRIQVHPHKSASGQLEGAVALFTDISDLMTAKGAAERSQSRLTALVDTLQDAILVLGKDLRVLYANQWTVTLFGLDQAPERLGDIFERAQIARLKKLVARPLNGKAGGGHESVRMDLLVGEDIRVFDITISPLRSMESGAEFTLRARDISAEVAAARELQRQREIAFATLNNIDEPILTLGSTGEVLFLNPVAEYMLSIASRDAAGLRIEEILRPPPEKAMPVHPIKAAIALENSSTLQDQAFVNRCGESLLLDLEVYPFRGERDSGAVLILKLSEKRFQEEDKLNFHANHDTLTGLLNRRSFESRFQHELQMSRGRRTPLTLLFLDLDQFKVVNDTCGHYAGDQLLKNISSLLRHLVRQHDLVARMGGDEFAILLVDCDIGQGRKIAEKIVAALREFRFDWQDKRFSVGVSIGMVEVDADQKDLQTLLAQADTACYAAKDNGRNKVVTHLVTDQDLRSRKEQMEWVSRLQRGLDQDQFELFVQPIEALGAAGSNACHGEILVRLRDEQGELVYPGAFLPSAYRYGMSPLIDSWVIERVLGHQRLQEIGRKVEHFEVSINLSPLSFSSDTFANALESRLIQSRFPLGKLTFEVVESGAISNLKEFLSFMARLRALGVKFALDDFGTGMSSFSYLKLLDVDYLKIDGSFVQELIRDKVNFAMVEAINRVAHLLNLKTVAEFVENSETRGALMALGVDFAQGFHLGHPIPLDDWLDQIESSVR